MKEGNIYKFERPKTPEPAPAEKGPLTSNEGKRLDFIGATVRTLQYLAELAKSDSNSYNPENIRLRREVLHEMYSDNDIRQAVVEVSQNLKVINKDPSWYHALIAEIRGRELIKGPASALIQEPEAPDDKTPDQG